MICHLNSEKLTSFRRKRSKPTNTADFLKAGEDFLLIFKELRLKYPETPSRLLVIAAINKINGVTHNN